MNLVQAGFLSIRCDHKLEERISILSRYIGEHAQSHFIGKTAMIPATRIKFCEAISPKNNVAAVTYKQQANN